MVKKVYGYIPEVELEPSCLEPVYLDDFLPFIEGLIASKRSWISRLRVFWVSCTARWSFKLWMIRRVLEQNGENG
jgi:hypothetical protein